MTPTLWALLGLTVLAVIGCAWAALTGGPGRPPRQHDGQRTQRLVPPPIVARTPAAPVTPHDDHPDA